MRHDIKRTLKITTLILTITCIGLYGFYQSRFLLQGPLVSIWNPEDGSSVSSSILDIQGEAKNISYITLDGRQIFVNEQGIFKEKILLAQGINAITVEAQDKFGRKTQNTINLFLKGSDKDAQTLTKK